MNFLVRGFSGFHSPISLIFNIVLVAGIALLVVAGVMYFKNQHQSEKEDPAVAILKQRLATGEISIEEYQMKMHILNPEVVEVEVVEHDDKNSEDVKED